MKKILLALFVAAPLSAQQIDSQCLPGNLPMASSEDPIVAQDACQKAIDLFAYLAPQLGTIVAGGNPTQGLTGTLGGPGHFSFGIRANGMSGSIPKIDRVVPATDGATNVESYPVDDQLVGFVTADLGVGVFKGMASSGFGALDALISASYLPEYSNPSVEVSEPSGGFKFGFGAKLGLLRETSVRPGIAVSYLVRQLPTVAITGKSGEDRLSLQNVSIKAKSWRATAGKSFAFIGFGGGFGRDTYDSNADITVAVAPREATQGGTGGPIRLTQDLTRTNVFGTVWLNAKVMRIVGELGRVTGGTIDTFNRFADSRPDDARTYYSVGLSFGR